MESQSYVRRRNTADNWTPMTIPNGPTDITTFALSNTTNVSISEDSEISSIMFTSPAANAYAMTVTRFTLTISGVGIINNSATTQQFVANGGEAVNGEFGSIRFGNSATAGTPQHLPIIMGQTTFLVASRSSLTHRLRAARHSSITMERLVGPISGRDGLH